VVDGAAGLDLSLRNTGMCYVPPGWNGHFDTLFLSSFGTVKTVPTYGKAQVKAFEEIRRSLDIANRIVGFLKRHEVRNVSIEGYAYSFAGKNKHEASASVTKLAELGGIVKSQIMLSCRTAPVVIQPNSARKIVVGPLKRGGAKEQVKVILKTFGFNFDNLDEMDAFVTAYALYCEVNEIDSVFLS
jgi:hypothetical protein